MEQSVIDLVRKATYEVLGKNQWGNAERVCTWKDLHTILCAIKLPVEGTSDPIGFDGDEYLSFTFLQSLLIPGVQEDSPVWDDTVRRIAAYWVVGGSEGYYVHIDVARGSKNPQANYTEHYCALLGKFWDWQRAELCANVTQYVVNRLIGW